MCTPVWSMLRHLLGGLSPSVGWCGPACPNVSGQSTKLHCAEGSKQLFLYCNKLFVADTGYMCAKDTLYPDYLICNDSSTLGGSWGTLQNQGHQWNLLYSARAIGTSLVPFWVLCLQMTQQVSCHTMSCWSHNLQGTLLMSFASSKTTLGSSKNSHVASSLSSHCHLEHTEFQVQIIARGKLFMNLVQLWLSFLHGFLS